MPHCHSIDARRKRAVRAVRFGFVQSKMPLSASIEDAAAVDARSASVDAWRVKDKISGKKARKATSIIQTGNSERRDSWADDCADLGGTVVPSSAP